MTVSSPFNSNLLVFFHVVYKTIVQLCNGETSEDLQMLLYAWFRLGPSVYQLKPGSPSSKFSVSTSSVHCCSSCKLNVLYVVYPLRSSFKAYCSFSLVLWQASEELYDMLLSMLIRIRWAWTKDVSFLFRFVLWNYSHLCLLIYRKWAVMTTCGLSSTCWWNSWLVSCPGGKLKTKYEPLCICQHRFVIPSTFFHWSSYFSPLSAFRSK